MGGEIIQPAGLTWREIGMKWLVNQGVSTVLLFCIVFGGGYMAYVMIPQHLATIQQGYERIADRHDKAVEKLAESHEKSVDRIANILEGKQ
jgi:hypothetical protein